MSEFKDDTFLARWLNNDLSDEELEAIKRHPDYEHYRKIALGSETILPASFDKEELLEKVKEGMQEHGGLKKSNQRWLFAVAASLITGLSIVLYVFLLQSNPVTHETTLAEKKEIQLPDGSSVIINANSTLSYTEEGWEENREVNLRGEGYFSVAKGSKFTVVSQNGRVSVLGTQFNIQEIDDFFEVTCYEGKVLVESGEEQVVLKPMRSVRRVGRTPMVRASRTASEPAWMENKSSFASVSMVYVLKAIGSQYGVSFKGSGPIEHEVFTGTFPHDDLDLTLKLVLGSLDVNYELNGKVVVISN